MALSPLEGTAAPLELQRSYAPIGARRHASSRC